MRAVDIIDKKKNGLELEKKEIDWLIKGYINKEIPDYQLSAFCMAVYFKGMTAKETAYLTDAMMHSGDVIDLSKIKGIKIDKHSTGGVGDKTTIALAPIIASLGIPVAKMSGRGLGFTGGTLDKLESIPGYKVDLSQEQFTKQVNEIGVSVISQTGNIVPADKMLYALRDVTGTVNSLPLIASSIMSKKLATGSDAIMLDVKCGDGAFMDDYDSALELATQMINIGKELNKDVKAEITSMDQPLGRAIGNKNEILEAIDTLKGQGPDDFTQIVFSSAATILQQVNKVETYEEGIALVNEAIHSGKALEKFKEWISFQGGDVDKLFLSNFWSPKETYEIKAKKSGYVELTSAIKYGIAAMQLGAGRATKDDSLDYDAGIYINKQTNEFVNVGDVIFTLYSNSEIKSEIIDSLSDAYKINPKKVERKLILGTIK